MVFFGCDGDDELQSRERERERGEMRGERE